MNRNNVSIDNEAMFLVPFAVMKHFMTRDNELEVLELAHVDKWSGYEESCDFTGVDDITVEDVSNLSGVSMVLFQEGVYKKLIAKNGE